MYCASPRPEICNRGSLKFKLPLNGFMLSKPLRAYEPAGDPAVKALGVEPSVTLVVVCASAAMQSIRTTWAIKDCLKTTETMLGALRRLDIFLSPKDKRHLPTCYADGLDAVEQLQLFTWSVLPWGDLYFANPIGVVCFAEHVVTGFKSEEVAPIRPLTCDLLLMESKARNAVEMQFDVIRRTTVFNTQQELC